MSSAHLVEGLIKSLDIKMSKLGGLLEVVWSDFLYLMYQKLESRKEK